MMNGERFLLDSFDGTGYSQENPSPGAPVGYVLGAVAAFVGMTVLYTFLRMNLDQRAAAAITAVIVLAWVLWPSRRKEQQ
jgi:hypothetical protein